MDPSATVTIPLAPTVFWPLAFLVLFAVASLAVYAFLPDDRRPATVAGWLRKTGIPLWLAAFVGLVFAILFVMALWASFGALWSQIATPARPGEGTSGLGTSALIAALLGAPLILWRTMVAQRTVNIAQESHVTDLLARAVEQLGAEKTVKRAPAPDFKGKTAEARVTEETVPNLEVRIGAILALERLARQNLDVHVQIMEILTAYVRMNSPVCLPPDLPEPPDYTPQDHNGWVSEFARWSIVHSEKVELLRLREDIQLALNAIGRRSAEQRQVEARWLSNDPTARFVFDDCAPLYQPPEDGSHSESLSRYEKELASYEESIEKYEGYRIDLGLTNLSGANLTYQNFAGTKFDGANLHGVDFGNSTLNAVSLKQVNAQNASFLRAQMTKASFSSANLEGCNFTETKLQGTSFYYARLQGTSFVNAQMQFARLGRTEMQGGITLYRDKDGEMVPGEMLGAGTVFLHAKLQGASFYETKMFGARLAWAIMDGARLDGIEIDENTDLRKISLGQAKLMTIDFTGNRRAAEALFPSLPSCFGDASVILPTGMPRPAHWPPVVLTGEDYNTEYMRWLASPADYRYEPPPAPPP
jgi:uncharacterized protein YjbI with pentapeptide repeats